VKTFASELERRRIAADLSQDQLAVKAGVSRSTVQAAERGQGVSRRMVHRLAALLDWPIDDAIRLAAAVKPTPPRVTLSASASAALRAAAGAAGQSVDDYLAALLNSQPKAKGKK
jgi:transcriptional regulator with XRE-family HTH domain